MVTIGPAQPIDRRLLLPGAVAAAAVLVVDSVWLGLSAVDRPLAFSVAAVLAVLAGVLVAALLSGRAGLTALVAGGTVGSVLAAGIFAIATLNDALGFVGAFSLLVSDGLFGFPLGLVGFGYWTWTEAKLRARTSMPKARFVQFGGMLVVGCLGIAVATTLWPRAPRGTFAQNATRTQIRFYENVDGVWRQLGRAFDLSFRPGVTAKFIEPRDPEMTTVAGGLDSRGCTTHEIAARDPSGKDIAVHPPGLCDGETWIVTESGQMINRRDTAALQVTRPASLRR